MDISWDESLAAVADRLGGEAAWARAQAAGETVLSYVQWLAVRTPDFKAWFGDWESGEGSCVRHDRTGEPQVVMRGEHGLEVGLLATRLPVLTFASPGDANLYALSPNNGSDKPVVAAGHAAPRVIPGFLSIKRPFINSPGDPFIDFSTIAEKLGQETAIKLALKHSGWITHTNMWEEDFYDEYSDDVARLLSERPEALAELYCVAWPVLDDPDLVALLVAAGYDGAIHGPYGDSDLEMDEYKVFSPDQVRAAYAPHVGPAAALTREAAAPPLDLPEALAAYQAVRSRLMVLDEGAVDRAQALAELAAQRQALITHLVALPSDDLALRGHHAGNEVFLGPSPKREGNFQLTRFTREGRPYADAQYLNKEQAIADFIDEAIDDFALFVPPALASMAAPAVMARRGATPGMGWMKPAQAEAELRAMGLGTLLDAGEVVIHATGDSLPGMSPNKHGIAGLATLDGVIHVNAAAHCRTAPLAHTILHESFHARVAPLIGDKAWRKLIDRLDILYEGARTGRHVGPWYVAAQASIDRATRAGDVLSRAEQVEEFGAYALEHYTKAPPLVTRWVHDALGAVKAWGLRRFGMQLGEVTPAQLQRLAKSALSASLSDTERAQALSRRAGALARRVWHGSAQAFERFSTAFVGQGSGRHASHGWGLNFSDDADIAEFFRRQAAAGSVGAAVTDALAEAFPSRIFTDEERGALAQAGMRLGDPELQARRATWQVTSLRGLSAAALASVVSRVQAAYEGHLHAAAIPDDGHFIHWDEPLSEQSPAVRAILDRLWAFPETRSGQAIYYDVGLLARRERAWADLPLDEAASRLLDREGIAGLRYHNQLGTGYNWVVFSDRHVARLDTCLVAEIDTGTRAFVDLGTSAETARCLREAADRVHAQGMGPDLPLMDANGLRVGCLRLDTPSEAARTVGAPRVIRIDIPPLAERAELVRAIRCAAGLIEAEPGPDAARDAQPVPSAQATFDEEASLHDLH